MMDDNNAAEERAVEALRLRELIDAARPDGDDLGDPNFSLLAERLPRDAQLRSQWQRSQRLDHAITDALNDLPVPPGSVERLLGVLAAAAQVENGVADNSSSALAVEAPRRNAPLVVDARDVTTATTGEPGPEGERKPPHGGAAPDKASRTVRWPWAGPMSLAMVATVVLMALVLWRPVQEEWGPDEILNSDWLLDVAQAADAGQSMDEHPAPKKFPASSALTVRPGRWQWIDGLLGRTRGVAYTLQNGAARATLYVVDADSSATAPRLVNLAARPGASPITTTQGLALSVWQQDNLVYVLAVQGGEAEYKAFVTAAPQLARAGHGVPALPVEFSAQSLTVSSSAESN